MASFLSSFDPCNLSATAAAATAPAASGMAFKYVNDKKESGNLLEYLFNYIKEINE
jgi:hypothetical protein